MSKAVAGEVLSQAKVLWDRDQCISADHGDRYFSPDAQAEVERVFIAPVKLRERMQALKAGSVCRTFTCAELGFGISTIITTSLVHLLLVAMVLVGSFPVAVLLGTVFGLVRGATILAAHGVDSPEQLRTLHQRLDSLRNHSRSGVLFSLVLATFVGIGGMW